MKRAGLMLGLAALLSACNIIFVTDETISMSNLEVETDYGDDTDFYICDTATTEVTYRFNYEGDLESWTQELLEYEGDEFTGRSTLQRTVRPTNNRATVTGDEVTFSFLVNPGEALESSPSGEADTRLSVEVTSVEGGTDTLTAELPTSETCQDDSRFDDATEVSVNPDFSETAGQDTLEAGETGYYLVNLSEDVAANNDIVIVEANAEGDSDPFRVTAYSQQGEEVFASVDSEYFARASEIQTADIDPNQVCAGPCVAVLANDGGSAYFSVENTGSSEETFDLFVVATPFIDTTEPNDELSSAAQVSEEQAAAIEFVGDEDFLQSAENASRVTLVGSSPGLDLQFDVYDESGRTLGSGDADNPYVIPEGEPAQNLIANVYSGDGRAGVGADANYTLRFDRLTVPVSVD